MGNEIPTKSREVVRARDMGTCIRCGMGGTDWHHRRRRAVKNGHFQHCPCIGVTLCRTCHAWAHANPRRAQETGFIISAYEDEPFNQPIKMFGQHWATFDCEGNVHYLKENDHEEDQQP